MSDNISKYVAAISNKSNFDKVNEEKNKYDQEFANNHISNTLADMDINSHAENGVVRVYPQHVNKAKRVLSRLGYTYKVVGSLKEDLDESVKYGVYFKGGSIGDHMLNTNPENWSRHGKLRSTHDSEEEAKEHAKFLNKSLSPGEKKYYGMKYHVKPLKRDIKESLDYIENLSEEELMELDKKTLASYIKKATSDRDKQRENVISYKTKTDNIDQFIKQNSDHIMPLIDKEKIYQSFGNPKEKEAIAFNRAQKRGRGIRRATDRLVKESTDDILDKHIQNFSKGIKSSEPKNSRYRNNGKIIPDTKYIETDAGHQDIFNHLTKKMGYYKTKGPDPEPHKFTLLHNYESMTTVSDPVHHTDRISVSVGKEHGDKKTHVIFSKWPNINESLNLDEEHHQFEDDGKMTWSNWRNRAKKYGAIKFIDTDTHTHAYDKDGNRISSIKWSTKNDIKESNDKDVYGNPISAREKLYRNHQNIRKKAGLPDPNYYLELAKKKKQELEQMQDKVNK